MKYFKFVCYSLLLMLLFNTSSLYAAPPLDGHTQHTPLSLMPEPLSGSHDTLKLAATWWLPDWQGSQGSRGSDDAGGGDHDGNCEKNDGMHTPSNIDGRYICSKYNYNVTSSLKCHVNCRCKDEYKYTSSNCSGNYTTAGTSCEGKYNQCVCKSEFKYNSSNCSGENQPSGTSCGGNYNGCTIRPECTVSSKDCTYGCAGYNSCDRCTSCKSNPDCDVSDKSCGSLGCASYNSCSKCTSCNTDPCSGVSCGSNAYCSGGSCYCNSGYKKCNGSCISNSSCCGGCSSNQTCQNGSCVTNTPSCSDTCPSYPYSSPSSCSYDYDSCYDTCGGKTWYKCISAPADPCSGVSCGSNAYCSGGSCYCNSGYHKSGSSCVKDEVHSHSYSCPSGYSSSNSWGSSAQTTSKTCSCGAASGTCYKAPAHTHSYSCPSGSQASSCSSSQVQTGTTSKVSSCGAASGTCYSCRAKTCSDGGYSNSSNPSSAYMCSTISYSGLTCYSCRYCGALGNRENYDSSACNGMIASTRTDDCGRTVYKCGLSGGGLLNLCNNYAGVCRQRCNAVGYENWDGTDGGRPAKYCAMAAE